MGLQHLFETPIAPGDAHNALRDLGSDVPFFAVGGQALGTGRGDVVSPMDSTENYSLVLVDPGVAIATAEAYSWLTRLTESNSIEGFCGQAVSDYGVPAPVNDFEVPVFERFPQLAEIRDKLLELGAYRAALSGSGSTVFGQYHTETDALRAALAFEGHFRVRTTKPLPRSEYFHRMVEE
jgi:4-diphosphocytidyl-2-C-methyl-D-erythritol kinase